MTNYYVGEVDLFSGVDGPGQPVGADGYDVGETNLFSYYTNKGVNYQSNLSGFDYIYQGTPFDIMLYNYFSKASIGTPGNATFSKINNRLCWKIIGNTTVNVRFPNITTINFVAVGGGQTGFGNNNGDNGIGGRGGWVVTGQLLANGNSNLTIGIGSSQVATTINYVSFSVTANAGNSGTAGSITGTGFVGTPTSSLGGAGGQGTLLYPDVGGNGPFISDLGIYVAGGGGREGTSMGSAGGLGGGGDGGDYWRAIRGSPGTPNTGGGGGGGGGGGNGGSGVVYLYL
jgi:hypothetical protein